MTPHPVDLEALQKLLDEGAKTPWKTCGAAEDCPCGLIWAVPSDKVVAQLSFEDEDGEWSKAVAIASWKLIVAAVNALPALLAEVRAARQVEGALVRLLETQTISFSDEQAAAIDYACDEVLKRRIEPKEPAALASPSVPPPPKAQEAGAGFTPAATPEGRLAQWAAGHDPYTPAQEAGEETAALKEGASRPREEVHGSESEVQGSQRHGDGGLDASGHAGGDEPGLRRERGEQGVLRGDAERVDQPHDPEPGGGTVVQTEHGSLRGLHGGDVAARGTSEQPTAGPPKAPAALPKEEVAPGDDSPFGDDERAAYDAQIETVQAHAIREEEENARFRAALRACLALFANIRGDWTDPRRECRAGKAIIDAALSGETNLLRTLLDNEEQLAKESQ